MGSLIAVFDANILIDLLNGSEIAIQTVESYSDRAVSVVTWMEVLAGAKARDEENVRRVLSDFERIELTDAIAERAIIERRIRRVKLPDAIAIATAIVQGGVLLTRNTKDFPHDEVNVRIPYRLPIY